MGIIELICKHCSGQMELDDSREVAFCSFCGTKHVIKDEVNKNITINKTEQTIVKNFHGSHATDYKDADELVDDALLLTELKQADKAFEKFKKAIEIDPKNYMAWVGYAAIASISLSPEMRRTGLDAYEVAYKLIPEGSRDGTFKMWLSETKNFSEYLSMFKVAEEAHRDILLEKWLSNTTQYDMIYGAMDDPYKKVVLEKWNKNVKESGGYSKLYIFLNRHFGKEYIEENFLPGWIKNIKEMLDSNAVSFDVVHINLTFRYLDADEKEKMVRKLVSGYISNIIPEGKSVLKTLCTEDEYALGIIEKMMKSKKYYFLNKEYVKELKLANKTAKKASKK